MKKLIPIYIALAVMFYLITAFICGTFNIVEMRTEVKAVTGCLYLITNLYILVITQEPEK